MTTPPTPTTGHVLCDKEDKERTEFWCICTTRPHWLSSHGCFPVSIKGCDQYWQKPVKQEEGMSEEIADYLHACQAAAENTAVSVHYREGGKFDSLAARSVRKLYAELAQANAELAESIDTIKKLSNGNSWPAPISTKDPTVPAPIGAILYWSEELQSWMPGLGNRVNWYSIQFWIHAPPPIPKQEPEVSEAEAWYEKHNHNFHTHRQEVIAAFNAGRSRSE